MLKVTVGGSVLVRFEVEGVMVCGRLRFCGFWGEPSQVTSNQGLIFLNKSDTLAARRHTFQVSCYDPNPNPNSKSQYQSRSQLL
jgi:hypothetical protein